MYMGAGSGVGAGTVTASGKTMSTVAACGSGSDAGTGAGCQPAALGRPRALPKGGGASAASGGGKADGIGLDVMDWPRAASSASRAAKRGAMLARVATGAKELAVGVGGRRASWGGGAGGVGGLGQVAGVKPV
jgi:hypothetical protein